MTRVIFCFMEVYSFMRYLAFYPIITYKCLVCTSIKQWTSELMITVSIGSLLPNISVKKSKYFNLIYIFSLMYLDDFLANTKQNEENMTVWVTYNGRRLPWFDNHILNIKILTFKCLNYFLLQSMNKYDKWKPLNCPFRVIDKYFYNFIG